MADKRDKEMPPLDLEYIKKLKEAWKDGLTKANKDPEKYLSEMRVQMSKAKTYKGFYNPKKKKKSATELSTTELSERIVSRFKSGE